MKTREELLSDFDILSTEYIRLLNDKEVLLEWGKPQLEALYANRIGVHQIELLQIQLQIKGLKRKIELVRMALNRGELPNLKDIQDQVDEELIIAQIEINFQVAQVEEARKMLATLSSPERSAELRKIFKKMARLLHPDVNPNLTPEQTELWHKVKNAYDTGDLDQLKAIQILYEDQIKGTEEGRATLSEDELGIRVEVLKEGIKVLEQQIQSIRSQFPFDMEEQIRDEEWVKEKVESILAEVETHRQLEARLKQELNQLCTPDE